MLCFRSSAADADVLMCCCCCAAVMLLLLCFFCTGPDRRAGTAMKVPGRLTQTGARRRIGELTLWTVGPSRCLTRTGAHYPMGRWTSAYGDGAADSVSAGRGNRQHCPGWQVDSGGRDGLPVEARKSRGSSQVVIQIVELTPGREIIVALGAACVPEPCVATHRLCLLAL